MPIIRRFAGAEPVRINKWLAQEGVCSRREAETLIERGLVSIDGARVEDLGRKIEPGQTLTLADKGAAQLDAKHSIVLHKPVGYVSGTPEGEQIPAVRLIKRDTRHGGQGKVPGRGAKLAPIGRLDQDSRGLLILSEDGVLAKAVIGPESEVEKEYLVRVRGQITPDKLSLLRSGLELDGRRLKTATIVKVADQTLRFVLREGRNRQIRRMCELVDLRVADLLRLRVGAVRLGDLPEGAWRPLSPAERAGLLRRPSPKPTAGRGKRRGAAQPVKPS